MLITAAQNIAIRNQGLVPASWDFENVLGGGILNGFVAREGEKILVEKRGGFVVDTVLTLALAMDVGDYICGATSSAPGGVGAASIGKWDASTGDISWVYGGNIYTGLLPGTPTNPVNKVKLGSIDGIQYCTTMEMLYWLAGQGQFVLTLASAGPFYPSSPCWGNAALNGRVYVGQKTTGNIYNSGAGTPGTFNSLEFIKAYRSGDGLRAVFKHRDCVVGVGYNSMEFFYQDPNAPATGSPLRRRDDVFHAMSVYSVNSIDTINDATYFVGGMGHGDYHTMLGVGVYVLENFQIRKISTDAVDRFIAATAQDSLWGSVMSNTASGKPVYLITKNIDSSVGDVTLAYDILDGFWYFWSYGSSDSFKLVGQIDFDYIPPIVPSLIMRDGTILRGDPNNLFQDNGTNYKFAIRTQAEAHGSSRRKHFPEFGVLGDLCSTGSWSIRYSDNDYASYSAARTLDATTPGRLKGFGSALKRAWEISLTANTRARLEAFDLGNVRVGL